MSYAERNWTPVVDSQGEKTDPTTATVMADTGALDAGTYDVLALVSASANAQLQLQHLNVANDGAASDVIGFYIPANSLGEIRGWFAVQEGERIRVMMDGNLTGTATCWANVF